MVRSLVFLTLAMFSTVATAQGLLLSVQPSGSTRLPRPIPQPIRPGGPGFIYDIAKLEIDTSIRGQVAEVQVAQTFKNCTSRVMQVKFVFPLPYDGAIDQMTFMVDGEELEGRLLEADKARDIYQSYVRRSQDPALVQWIGTGMFQTQVFPVPAGAERTVSLRYTQVCKRTGNLNDWLLPLSPTKFTSKPIGTIEIRGRIRGEGKLGNVYSPSHDIEIDRESDKVTRFTYKAKHKVPKGDFRVMWDTGDDAVQLSVVSHRPDAGKDGYFMMMIQPQFPDGGKTDSKIGKNVILVMDKSGSMRGEKIDQARRAANYVVNRLKGRDNFTLITYDSIIENFRSKLSSADKSTRADANEFIDSMLAGGSTNIDGALKDALKLANQADGPAYVVFMTDGRPTVGERNAMQIAENARKQLGDHTRLFSLGVGHDVNSRLLDKLATIALGQTNYVRPGEELDKVVGSLYDRIGAPALTDAKIELTVDGKEGRTRQLYPSNMYDLFSGDQLVIVGRYRKHGELQIKLTGNFDGKPQKYVYTDELPKKTSRGKNSFVERLWATRRIGEIVDAIDLNGEERELVDELIHLSKKHGILTPYTAYLAEERTDLNDADFGRRVTRSNLRSLGQESGQQAFSERALKGQMKQASRPEADAFAMDSIRIAKSSSPAAAAPALPGSNGRGGSFGGGGGGLGAPGGAALPSSAPIIVAGEAKDDKAIPHEPIKQIGNKTFFLRANRYIDSAATKKQIESATKIEQFSAEYFKLLNDLDTESKEYLAQEREVLVVVKDKAYVIVLPTKKKD